MLLHGQRPLAAAALRCGIDLGSAAPSESCDGGSFTFTELSPGEHTLVIVGTDKFDNPGSPVEIPFFVDNGEGDVVLMGHDYADVAPEPAHILANAVRLSPGVVAGFTRPVRVVGFRGTADPTEMANVDAAIVAQLGPAATIDPGFSGTSPEDLGTALIGKDVLLIYDQNNPSSAGALGSSWGSKLKEFAELGGIVIVLDGMYSPTPDPGDTWELVSSAGLLNVTAATGSTGMAVVDTGSGDPLAAGVPGDFAPRNTVRFTNADPTATAVFSISGDPVVLRQRVDNP